MGRPRIPTGFHLKAQGCEERATLGHRPQPFPTATRLRPFRARGPITSATTPLALFPFPDTRTQGSPEKSGQPWAEGHYPVGDLCKTGVAAPRQRAASLILLGNAAVCRRAATMDGGFAEISVGIEPPDYGSKLSLHQGDVLRVDNGRRITTLRSHFASCRERK